MTQLIGPGKINLQKGFMFDPHVGIFPDAGTVAFLKFDGQCKIRAHGRAMKALTA
jgi:hypothetical protein